MIPSHWLFTADGMQRTDGFVVQRSLTGWLVLPPDDRPVLTGCPHCGSAMRSAEQAIKVADHYYPLEIGRALRHTG